MSATADPNERFNDEEYMNGLESGVKHIDLYSNWSVSPCMFKYGMEVVEADLIKLCKQSISIRVSTPLSMASVYGKVTKEDIYWIAEVL